MTARVDPLLEVLDEEGRAYWGLRLAAMSMADLRELWSAAVLSRAKHQCDRCGSTDRLVAVPHKPLRDFASHTLENGHALCATCNLDRNLHGCAPDMQDRHVLSVQMPRALYTRVREILDHNRTSGGRPKNFRRLVERMARWIQDDPDSCHAMIASLLGDGEWVTAARTTRTTVRVRSDLFDTLIQCSDDLETTLQGLISTMLRLFVERHDATPETEATDE